MSAPTRLLELLGGRIVSAAAPTPSLLPPAAPSQPVCSFGVELSLLMAPLLRWPWEPPRKPLCVAPSLLCAGPTLSRSSQWAGRRGSIARAVSFLGWLWGALARKKLVGGIPPIFAGVAITKCHTQGFQQQLFASYSWGDSSPGSGRQRGRVTVGASSLLCSWMATFPLCPHLVERQKSLVSSSGPPIVTPSSPSYL